MKDTLPQVVLPAEFEKHEATWIAWPHNKNDWPGKFAPINWVYTEIVRILCESEKVNIIVKNENQKKAVVQSLKKISYNSKNVKYFILDTDRSWLRDTFPKFLKDKRNGKIKLVQFRFNAWAKYNNWHKDIKVPEFISKKRKMKLIEAKHHNAPVVLEGGSIDCNGKGVILTTEECLLDNKIQTRNPGFDNSDYRKVFSEYLGCKEIIWLGKGIVGDDTHGHVDDICRFVNYNTVVLAQEDNPRDPNYQVLRENKERLEGVKLLSGNNLNVIYLPMPAPVIFENQRLPASYANFYISNKYVIVPTFNDINDKKALGILSELFSDRKVIGIHSVDLVWGLGTLHCLTHEEPEEN